MNLSTQDRPNRPHLALSDLLTAIPRALLVSEVAELLNISERLVYRMAKERSIPSIRIAGCIRFDPLALAWWLRQNTRIRDDSVSIPYETQQPPRRSTLSTVRG